jgi:hypothetical protein
VDIPEVRFADASGVGIAWQQFGHGPDVLVIPPLVSNVELPGSTRTTVGSWNTRGVMCG